MKFTFKWLKEYLNFDSSPEDLCEKLTSLGLEVEVLKNPKKFLSNFIISKIKSFKKHPNADKLSVCEVFDGKNTFEIVCGAKNVRTNLISVLAPVGSIINPNTNDEFVIKKSKIRGVESNGMLCSEQELGLSDNSHGIIELEKNYKVGESFSNYIDDEEIKIEISITPNRVDCAGVYGIARDLSASGFGKLKKKIIKKNKEEFTTPIKLINHLKENDCPQFFLRLVKDVKNIKSPVEFERRLKNSDIKIISGLVDVTNYISNDSCRPLHVFDNDKIVGDIVIRHSKKGEKFKGLDDQDYILDDGMIIICDSKKILSLAGVIGGKESACTEETKNVLIESAYFLPEKISYSGRKLNILSDARYRFERGIDPESTIDGLEEATSLILKHCGGIVGSIISDNQFDKTIKEITVDKKCFSKILGLEIESNFIISKLKELGCEVSEKNKDLIVVPPSWRPDIKIKEDLVEEIARMYGFEKIPSQKMSITKNKKINSVSDNFLLINKLKKILTSRNIMETITWSFLDKSVNDDFNQFDKSIIIENPISSDLNCLRSSLIPNLLNVIKKNNKKDIKNISIFELGPVFFGNEPGDQSDVLTVIRSGFKYEKSWIEKNREFDLFDIKADLISCLKTIGFNHHIFKQKNENVGYFHPGKSGCFYLGHDKIADLGEIHPNILKKFDIDNCVNVFELSLTKIISFYKNNTISKKELKTSPYQSSIRDFSFEMKKEILSHDIISLVKKIDSTLIKDVSIFDHYEGKGLEKNYKSISVEVKIQSDIKTLTENEIQDLSKKIIDSISNNFSARLR